MAFYEFRQNNSGGSFDVDDKLCANVIIEAESIDEANNKAIKLGIYFDGCSNGTDCSCCGDRWSEASDYNEMKFPVKWSELLVFQDIDSYITFKVNQGWAFTSPDTRIFYSNGEMKEFYKESTLPLSE